MARAARVRLFWSPSPSPDTVKQIIRVYKDGQLHAELPVEPGIVETRIRVRANHKLQFDVLTVDSEGITTLSDSYFHQFGDFQQPLPATDLGHQTEDVFDLPDDDPMGEVEFVTAPPAPPPADDVPSPERPPETT